MKNTITILLITFTIIACKAQINPFKLERKKIPPLSEIQEAIEYNLNHIKIEDSDYYRIYSYPSNNHQRYFYNYFSEEAKERMIELFEGKWTEEEIQSGLASSMSDILDTLNIYNGYYKDAKRMAKRDSSPLQQVWDSMLAVRKNKYRKSIIENKYVDYKVISIAGYLKDPRFLPFLIKMEEENGNIYSNVKLALARYKEEPYYSNAIKKYTYGEGFKHDFIWDLQYICTNEAIKEIYNYVMNENEESCDSNGECHGYWIGRGISALQLLFDSKDYFDEILSVEYKYDIKNIKPDEAYLKKMRAITEKYYMQFKDQEPDCENVPVNAW